MANISLGDAYVQIMPSAQGIKGAITGILSRETDQAGRQAGGNLSRALQAAGESGGRLAGLKVGAGLLANVASAGISAGASLVGAIKDSIIAGRLGEALSASINAGAALEQSFGGLDTLYGGAADQAKRFAQEAAAAGISANDYAEQAVSFGASLKQAFGGDAEAAVQAANTAILDMADNAAKMGTPLASIQTAYQGFAKGNYTMLDNLKLGYGGTKEEMERLLADAQKLTGVKYDITNLGDVYSAIHVIQEDLGLTGTAATEASTTFTGSFAAMQASAQNLLANLALGQDIGPSLQTLLTSVETFAFGNLFPMIGNIISQIPQLIGDTLLRVMGDIPGLLDSAITFINNLAEGITSGEGTISETLTTIGHAALEMFKNIDWAGLGSAVISLIGAGLSALFEAIPTILTGIGSAAVELFKEIDWAGLGSSVITLIVEGIDWVFDNVPQLLLNIGNAAVELFKDVDWLQLGKDVIGLIVDGINWLFDNIPQVMEDIANEAVEWFESIDWLDVGKNIVNGIIDGIWSVASNLWDTVTSLASGAESRAESWLGIASPSTVFRDNVGRWIPAGIAEGIEDGAGQVDRALEQISAESTGAIDGMAIGQNAGIYGETEPSRAPVTFTNTFNIQQQPGQSARELAQEVIRIMTLNEQQQAAVWG